MAAGNGKRLGELTRECPKPLVAIHDRPILYFPLERMVRAGIRDIGIVIQPRFRGNFEAFLQKSSRSFDGVSLTLLEQDEALGMAHALKMARKFVGDSQCIVLAGDSVNSFDFTEAVKGFRGGAAIFARRESDRVIQRASGVVEIDDSGRVTRITEKPETPASDLLQIGGGIYDVTLFERIDRLLPSARGEYEITGVHESYISTGDITCEDMGDAYYNNVTYPEDVERASLWFQKNHALFAPIS